MHIVCDMVRRSYIYVPPHWQHWATGCYCCYCCCCYFINMPCRHLQNTHCAQSSLARVYTSVAVSVCECVLVCSMLFMCDRNILSSLAFSLFQRFLSISPYLPRTHCSPLPRFAYIWMFQCTVILWVTRDDHSIVRPVNCLNWVRQPTTSSSSSNRTTVV